MDLPNSQKATRTELSVPLKTAARRARYSAHEEDGEPGMGSRPEVAGVRFMARHSAGGRVGSERWMMMGECDIFRPGGRRVVGGELKRGV